MGWVKVTFALTRASEKIEIKFKSVTNYRIPKYQKVNQNQNN